jgi:DNA-binding NarL/FixJ family response regulator
MNRPRVLLGDDHLPILESIRELLISKYDVVASAADGRRLVEEALRLKPDVVVLDVSMPLLNGIDAAKQIRKALPETRFVFLSMHIDAIYVRKALEAGGSAYVLKSGAADELRKAMDLARVGQTYLSPALGERILQDVNGMQAPPPGDLFQS